MPKDEWGVKRLCPHCASRFYDLRHDPMTCPECGQTFTAESLVPGRGRSIVAEKAVAKEPVAEIDDIDDEADLDEDAADVELDDDLLEDDDDDDNVPLEEIADVGGGDDD